MRSIIAGRPRCRQLVAAPSGSRDHIHWLDIVEPARVETKVIEKAALTKLLNPTKEPGAV
jgi:hypothetical protein